MKNLIGLVFGILFIQVGFAQQPLFSVVRPNGQTFIYPTWDSAYNKSLDGDIIYLPGTRLTSIYVDKEITLIGTGHNPDSAGILGITELDQLYGPKKLIVKNMKIANYSVAANSIISNINTNVLTLGNGANIYIEKSIIYILQGSCNSQTPNNSIFRNSFISMIIGLNGVSFDNCIVLGNFATSSPGNLRTNQFCTFKNTIFNGYSSIGHQYGCNSSNNNSFMNCLFTQSGTPEANSLNQNNHFNVNPSTLFVKGGENENYSYKDNYHLPTNSPYLTAGSDGKQIGIYGGSTPWQDGSLPSNPYIYFKKVDQNSSTDGKLKVEYKVRTGN